MEKKEVEERIEEAFREVLNMLKNEEEPYIYNEISLQNELGLKLREKFKNNKKIRVFFEKNVKSCYKDKEYMKKKVKKEIDLFICNGSKDTEGKKEAYAIELKFVKGENNRVPENLYDFVKDMRFMEQVKDIENESENKENIKYKIVTTYSLVVVDNEIYTRKKHEGQNGIYKFFRNNKEDNSEINISKGTIIVKPTKNKEIKYYKKHCDLIDIIKKDDELEQEKLKKIIESMNLEEGSIYIKLKRNWKLKWQKIGHTNYYAYCGKVTKNQDKVDKINLYNFET